MERNNKGKFVKGHRGYQYWKNKKRGEWSEEHKKKISKSLEGFKRTDTNKKNISLSKLGKKNPNYKTGRIVTSSGHILLIAQNHPNKNYNGRMFEHRLVMEKKLGRYLKSKEIIHHIDGNPANNNINNLFLTTRSGNSKAHHSITKSLKYLLDNNIIKFDKKNGIYKR